MRFLKSILFLSTLVLLGSCASLVTFSSDLKNKYHLADSDIPKLQFYNSGDIILYKDAVNGKRTIEGGKIKVIDGREVEEIIIQEKTKGIAIKNLLLGQNLGVSFEISDSYFLTFGPNPKFGDKYCLLASNWRNDIGEVTYNDEKFRTPSTSGRVYLLVNVKKLEKLERSSRIAKGRKVKG